MPIYEIELEMPIGSEPIIYMARADNPKEAMELAVDYRLDTLTLDLGVSCDLKQYQIKCEVLNTDGVKGTSYINQCEYIPYSSKGIPHLSFKRLTIFIAKQDIYHTLRFAGYDLTRISIDELVLKKSLSSKDYWVEFPTDEHPKVLCEYLEVIAKHVNLGSNFVLATFSPNVLQHLNVLTALKDKAVLSYLEFQQSFPNSRLEILSEEYKGIDNFLKRKASILYTKDYKSFIPYTSVEVYSQEEGEWVSQADLDYGFRWDTLSDVSVELQTKYVQLMEHEMRYVFFQNTNKEGTSMFLEVVANNLERALTEFWRLLPQAKGGEWTVSWRYEPDLKKAEQYINHDCWRAIDYNDLMARLADRKQWGRVDAVC